MLYFESSDIKIDWDEALQCVVMEWKGYVSGTNFRDIVNKGLDLLIEKNGHKWLADLGKMGVISQDDQKWADEDWFPRAMQSGMRVMAMVRPERVLSQISVKNVMTSVGEETFESQYFDNLETAKAWIGAR